MPKRNVIPKEIEHVEPQRRTVMNGVELLLVEKDVLVLPDRGGIALMRILGQAYDGPNVTALEVEVGQTRFLNVRKLDKALELRMQAAWRKAVLRADMDIEIPQVQLSVTIVIS